jgi:hypothetical protein
MKRSRGKNNAWESILKRQSMKGELDTKSSLHGNIFSSLRLEGVGETQQAMKRVKRGW